MILVLPIEEIKELFDKEKEQCQLMGHSYAFKTVYQATDLTFEGVPINLS